MSADELAKLAAGLSPKQRALLLQTLGREPIAVVGMAARLPGAPDVDAFWRLLESGRHAIREVPRDRWDAAAFYDADPAAPGKMTTRWGAFLDEVDGFDAAFFGISPREAARMDPQQRLALEVAWEAFQDGGLAPEEAARARAGVYMGVTHYDQAFSNFAAPAGVGGYDLTGSLLYSVSGRISHFMDLRGPSVSLDAACASSLVAVHLAAQGLRDGETDLAVAGGVNLVLHPAFTIAFTKSGAMSPQGRCKSFGDGDGFVRGEGCGVVILKRLADALRDGDRVHAVLRGSAVRHGGKGPGYTAPNAAAQTELFRAALRDAQIAAAQIGLVEAHATGTAVGDPAELSALRAVYGEADCVLGSGKTNIGHLESAAGVAGLIKTILSLQREMIPPFAEFKGLGPKLSLAGTRLVIPERLTPWPKTDRPRRAAVSSFGISGTIAHAILEEAPPVKGRAPAPKPKWNRERFPSANATALSPTWTASPASFENLFEQRWEPRPLPSEKPAGSRWLVLADRGGVAARLKKLLRAAGARLVDKNPDAVADLRMLDAKSERADASALLRAASLARVLAGTSTPPRLFLVTRRAHTAQPAQAALWGLARCARREYPGLKLSLIDIGGPEDAAGLCAELLSGGAPEAAWRGGRRFTPALEPLRAEPAASPAIRGGSFLITGGLGALGLRLAGRLAAEGAARLILLGRGSPSKEAAQAIARLKAGGTEISVARADASRKAQLAKALPKARLTGVFHAAGVLDDALIANLDRRRLSAVLAPKAEGAWNLHELTLGRGLEHFVLFSSVKAVLGNEGQAAYAAANAYLDGLAHYRRSNGLPALSVDWGGWSGAGMAAETGARGRALLSPERGLELLWTLLGLNAPAQAIAAAYDPRGEAPASPKSPKGKANLGTTLAEIIAKALRLPVSRLDARRPLSELGLDSIVAMEISEAVKRELGVDLPAAGLLGKASVAALAEKLAG